MRLTDRDVAECFAIATELKSTPRERVLSLDRLMAERAELVAIAEAADEYRSVVLRKDPGVSEFRLCQLLNAYYGDGK